MNYFTMLKIEKKILLHHRQWPSLNIWWKKLVKFRSPVLNIKNPPINIGNGWRNKKNMTFILRTFKFWFALATSEKEAKPIWQYYPLTAFCQIKNCLTNQVSLISFQWKFKTLLKHDWNYLWHCEWQQIYLSHYWVY